MQDILRQLSFLFCVQAELKKHQDNHATALLGRASRTRFPHVGPVEHFARIFVEVQLGEREEQPGERWIYSGKAVI